MTDIHIRKIDIDSLSSASDNPPSWAKIDAIVNGVGVKLTLTEEQTARLLDAATPIVMELVALVADAVDRNIVAIRQLGGDKQ